LEAGNFGIWVGWDLGTVALQAQVACSLEAWSTALQQTAQVWRVCKCSDTSWPC